ncbi:hypothetical protein GCM10023331_35960 [Algivirga pacifica]|uniref:HTH luxR-type domain-containing protein n=2 Tax=Algivirga pacifica TaxID=1162670 RepID=A0ABP9DNA4_9BACT
MELSVSTNQIEEGILLHQLGYELLSSDIHEAEQCILRSIQLLKASGNQEELSKALHTYGMLQLNKGQYATATKQLLKVMEIVQHLPDSVRRLAQLNNTLGTMHERIKDYTTAYQYLDKARTYALQLHGPPQDSLLCKIYLNMGSAYDGMKLRKEAIHHTQKALSIAQRLPYAEIEAKAANNLGNQYLITGDLERALAQHQAALTLKKKLGDHSSLPLTYISLGENYRQRKDYQKALSYFNEGLLCAQKYKAPYPLLHAHFYLFRLYQEMGDANKALEHHILYKKYTDQIQGNENTQKINLLIEQHELKKQQLFMQLEQEERNNGILILSVLFILSSLTIGFLFILQKAKTREIALEKERAILEHSQLQLNHEKLEQELHFKKKELTANVMHLLQKNELINKISSDLLSTQKNMRKEDQKAIRQIAMELQSSLNDEMWQEFEAHFQSVHGDFYERLQAQFPNLTPNERKICAFLRLNMSSKDIAAITHRSPKSIDMARFRLRKKLGLNNEDQDLNSFIASL